ncbi:unnamed protein product [Lepidochelys olivacea]
MRELSPGSKERLHGVPYNCAPAAAQPRRFKGKREILISTHSFAGQCKELPLNHREISTETLEWWFFRF